MFPPLGRPVEESHDFPIVRDYDAHTFVLARDGRWVYAARTPQGKWVMTRLSRSLASYFSETIKDWNVKFWHNRHSSLQFVLFIFAFDIFDSLETMRSSERCNFISFFSITFDWNGNFAFWLLYRKDLAQIYQNIPYYISKTYFFIYKNQFFKWKMIFFRFSNACSCHALWHLIFRKL